jgi:anti-sigma factor RsiW
MNCNEVRENLIELLAEGHGNPAVAAHVKECGACATELESLRKTMALLDEWEAPEPSPYFLTRLQAHVREERENQPHGWLAWFRKPTLAVSLAAVLAAGGVFLRLSISEPPQQAQVQPGTAVSDLEALDKNHDLYLNTDLLDELSGGPSDDVSE